MCRARCFIAQSGYVLRDMRMDAFAAIYGGA